VTVMTVQEAMQISWYYYITKFEHIQTYANTTSNKDIFKFFVIVFF